MSTRVLVAVVGAAVLVGGCSVLDPRSGGSTPTPIYGARTDDGGRSLVIGYEDGGCGGAPRPTTRQTPTAVTVTVALVRAQSSAACPADSQPRILVIALAAPLGHRRVVDGSTQKAIGVFDGSRLLRATVFPDAVSVRRDQPLGGGADSAQNWTQTYTRPTPQAGCTTSPAIIVTEGRGLGSIANDMFTPVPGGHDVSGSPAQFLQDPSAPGQYYLEWSPRSRPGWNVMIETLQTCRGGPALTAAAVLRFADGLR